MHNGMKIAAFAGALLLCEAQGLAQSGTNDRSPAGKIASFEDPALDAVTASELMRFESEAELRDYIARLKRIGERRKRSWSARRAPVRWAALQNPDPLCLPEVEECPAHDSEGEAVVVTGSRMVTPTITNNQTVGVDEGDIVKQIGDFLLVLRDGRIFSVDTRGGGLALADRIDVYRDPDVDIWYDEMLVENDRIIVAAYSYEEEATELSILAIDPSSGKLRREGVFLISSDDYYSHDNYATRIVGDRLVVYTPYRIERLSDPRRRPTVRRWVPPAERALRQAGGRPLLDARDIYRPVQRTAEPLVHGISVCPLGAWRSGRELDCSTTGFVAPQSSVMFVSPQDVFLWTFPGEEAEWSGQCPKGGRIARSESLPSAVFRLNVRSGQATVAGVSGAPVDQFSMDSRDGEFRALAHWGPWRCQGWWEEVAQLSFLKIPHRSFTTRFTEVPDFRFTPVPSPGAGWIENRFADDWLVYGGRRTYGSGPPEPGERPQQARLVAVPVGQPARALSLELPHNIIRIERVGDAIVVNGYRERDALDISLLKLGRAPRIASRVRLDGRYESEGRSHAFNATVSADGSGLFGIPTVQRESEAARYPWRSRASDLSFLTLTAAGALGRAGELQAGSGETAEGYRCDVSCINWYGNSRPIFTGGRIFGLMGSAIVEARIDGGRIGEIRRIDLTAPVPER